MNPVKGRSEGYKSWNRLSSKAFKGQIILNKDRTIAAHLLDPEPNLKRLLGLSYKVANTNFLSGLSFKIFGVFPKKSTEKEKNFLLQLLSNKLFIYNAL